MSYLPRPAWVAVVSLFALAPLLAAGRAPGLSLQAGPKAGGSTRSAPRPAAESELPAVEAALLAPLPARTEPLPAWSPPTLENLLGRLTSDPDLPAAASRTLRRGSAARRPVGSYATLRPNRIGAPAARLSGTLTALFGYGFSMEQQHEAGFALVQVASSQHPPASGTFLVKTGSDPGWYLLTLHLMNPFDHTIRVDSTLWPIGSSAAPHYNTQAVAAGAHFNVHRFFSASEGSTKVFAWFLRETNSASPCVALQAVTVDQLGS
jgi:hypothetical protein